MSVKEFVKKELSGWTLGEKIFIFLTVGIVFLLSLWMKDSKIATIYAIFGFLATFISGKGKISCYFFGIIAVILYSYLAWQNSLYGSLMLYLGYYLPMEFIGLFLWKNHLKKDTQEIEKTFLSDKVRVIYGVLAVIMSVAVGVILAHIKNKFPFFDGFIMVFSVLAFYLTAKRCIEQWFAWTVVNTLNVIMWCYIFISGEPVLAALLTWIIYFGIGIRFFYTWKKEIYG